MSFTFDTSTNIGKVRTLIGDTDANNFLLSDEEIQVFLDLRGDDIFLASADCLKRIASDKALLAKKIKAGNYEEDPKGMSESLLKVSKSYEEASENTPAEDVGEEFLTQFNTDNIIRERALRGDDT